MSTVPGYVSCVWIEWLMGYPRNWTLVSKWENRVRYDEAH